MKKIMATCLLFSLFSFIIPNQKADAGIIVYAAYASGDGGGNPHSTASPALAGIIFGGGTAIVGSLIGGVVAIFVPSLGLKIVACSIVLNADGSLHIDNIQKKMSETFAFIDNAEVLRQLSVEVKKSYEATNKENAFVSLTEEIVRKVLKPLTDGQQISDEQLALVIHTLK